MAKRVLTSLRLDKIAAVDRPCQEHATMTIMKRADSPGADGGANPAGDPAGDHIGNNGGNPMPDDVKKVADLEAQLAALAKKQETATADIASLTAKLAAADALAKMSDKEKAHLEGLKDDAAKKAFTDMSAADRAQAITKAAEGDEVLKVEGVGEIRKSVVGDASFAMFKAQQDRLDQQAKDIAKRDADLAKERDERVMSDLRKRADDEFSYLPGTVDERAMMLKTIAAQPEAVRKSFEAAFTAHQSIAKEAFTTRGHTGGSVSPIGKAAITAFEGKVADIRKRDNVDQATAMSKARSEFPDLFKAYNEAA